MIEGCEAQVRRMGLTWPDVRFLMFSISEAENKRGVKAGSTSGRVGEIRINSQKAHQHPWGRARCASQAQAIGCKKNTRRKSMQLSWRFCRGCSDLHHLFCQAQQRFTQFRRIMNNEWQVQ